MFDDRLEIWSPGCLPPPITLERLGHDQFSRNKVIANVLAERLSVPTACAARPAEHRAMIAQRIARYLHDYGR